MKIEYFEVGQNWIRDGQFIVRRTITKINVENETVSYFCHWHEIEKTDSVHRFHDFKIEKENTDKLFLI